MPQKNYTLHLKGFVGGTDFDRNYVDYIQPSQDNYQQLIVQNSVTTSTDKMTTYLVTL